MTSVSTVRARPLTLVVGVDFSSTSELAVAAAYSLAGHAKRGVVHLVHAVALSSAAAEMVYSPGDTEGELTRARERLAKLAPSDALPSGTEAVLHAVEGVPELALTAVARDVGADLVVVGTRGMNVVQRVLFGSVAEYVTRHAPCSVLTVRPRELVGAELIEPPCPECVAAERAGDPTHRRCPRHSHAAHRPHTYADLSDAFGGGSGVSNSPG